MHLSLSIFYLLRYLYVLNVHSHPQVQQTTVNKNISDSALLDTIEHRTFEYFWTGAEPNSGMAPERIHMDNDYPEHDQKYYCNRCGSGFGVMAILAGINRGYITRQQGLNALKKSFHFLKKQIVFMALIRIG